MSLFEDCLNGYGDYPSTRPNYEFTRDLPTNPPDSWWADDEAPVPFWALIREPREYLQTPTQPVTVDTLQALLDYSGIVLEDPMTDDEREDLVDAINEAYGFADAA